MNAADIVYTVAIVAALGAIVVALWLYLIEKNRR